jgi:predicted nucleotide-binding protein (sugar kinase/HSP70/actin superfamily)
MNTPESTLQRFFLAMFQWESDAYEKLQQAKKSLDDLEYDTEFRKLLAVWQDIHKNYLTHKERKIWWVVSMGIPYAYDPSTEVIIDTLFKNPSIVHIQTKKSGIFPAHFLYVLKKEWDHWKIDSKKRSSIDTNVWKTCIL